MVNQVQFPTVGMGSLKLLGTGGDRQPEIILDPQIIPKIQKPPGQLAALSSIDRCMLMLQLFYDRFSRGQKRFLKKIIILIIIGV